MQIKKTALAAALVIGMTVLLNRHWLASQLVWQSDYLSGCTNPA